LANPEGNFLPSSCQRPGAAAIAAAVYRGEIASSPIGVEHPLVENEIGQGRPNIGAVAMRLEWYSRASHRSLALLAAKPHANSTTILPDRVSELVLATRERERSGRIRVAQLSLDSAAEERARRRTFAGGAAARG